jgi:predicted MFS family arabinose efflux permease
MMMQKIETRKCDMLDAGCAKGGEFLGAGASQDKHTVKIPAASWYAVVVLAIINCFACTDRIALSILMERIKHDLNLTDEQLGVVSGFAFVLFYLVPGIPLAWVADRYSRVKLISVCPAAWMRDRVN